jgi:Flp pilus assembly protein TadD
MTRYAARFDIYYVALCPVPLASRGRMIKLKRLNFNSLHVTRQTFAVVFCISFMPGSMAQLPAADMRKWHIRLDSNFPMGHATAKKQSAGATKVSAEPDPLKRAQAAIQVNDDSDAISILSSAIKSNPKDRNLFQERGKCYLRNRQNYQALQDFTKAFELGAPTAVLYRERANAHFFLHNFDQCLRDLDGATKLSKPIVDDYLLRANCHSSLGNPQLVIENCTAALKLAPKNAEAYYVRAKAYSILNQQKLADSDYEKAVSLKK